MNYVLVAALIVFVALGYKVYDLEGDNKELVRQISEHRAQLELSLSRLDEQNRKIARDIIRDEEYMSKRDSKIASIINKYKNIKTKDNSSCDDKVREYERILGSFNKP